MAGDVFISIRGRVLVNTEALNMTESVGNYVKHRRVPIVIPEEKGFTTYFVPSISGESVAHGFQSVLAEEAMSRGLPVCELCKKGIFLKSSNKDILKGAFGSNPTTKELEDFVIKHCIVEDVGGFLYAERENVKRTSNFFTGYMIPVKETITGTVIDPQLHSRYALGTPYVKKGQLGQMLYYVELSSALYTFSFDLDTRYIGKKSFFYDQAGEPAVNNDERKKRIEVTIDSLKRFLIEFGFGAKKTRFLPAVDWDSITIGVSDDVWTVPSSFSGDYVERAVKKSSKVSYNTRLYMYPSEEKKFEEVVIEALDDAKKKGS